MIPLLPFPKLPRPVRLGLVAATWLTAGATAGPALAQGAVNGNPGIISSTIISYSVHEQLSFLPPTTANQQVNAYATEIIGRLAGGAALFDVTVLDAFGSAGVQAALASARATLLAAGGLGTAIAAPALLSSASATSSASSTIYSRDPSYETDTTGKYFAVTTINTFGPASLMVAVAGQPSTSANPGAYGECFINGSNARATVVQPSTTRPTCSPLDGGTLFVLPGQLDINIDTTFTTPINTATTVTSTTTLTQVYQLVATSAAAPTGVPEPAGWTVLAAGLAALGLVARRQART